MYIYSSFGVISLFACDMRRMSRQQNKLLLVGGVTYLWVVEQGIIAPWEWLSTFIEPKVVGLLLVAVLMLFVLRMCLVFIFNPLHIHPATDDYHTSNKSNVITIRSVALAYGLVRKRISCTNARACQHSHARTSPNAYLMFFHSLVVAENGRMCDKDTDKGLVNRFSQAA